MRHVGTILSMALFFAIAGCGQSDDNQSMIDNKEIYSLCPKDRQSVSKLIDLMQQFASDNEARTIDRSIDAQNELSKMEQGGRVLNSTEGSLTVLTVEKSDEFRISISNLGLKEKMALTVRDWTKDKHSTQVAELFDDIERSWVVQKVTDGVTDEPPCVAMNKEAWRGDVK